MKQLLVAAISLALFAQSALAADSKIDIAATDSPATLLPRLVVQKVEIYLKNGTKLAGKVESATTTGVHLSNLTGQEFFDAVIATGDVSAVVVRVR